jgi:hypothetical protein
MKSPIKSIKSGVICEVLLAPFGNIEEAAEVVAEATLAVAELANEEIIDTAEEMVLALSEAMGEVASVAFSKASFTAVVRFTGGQIYLCRMSQPLMRSGEIGLYGKFGS